MGQLDIAAKVLLEEVPEPFVRLFLGDVAIREVRAEQTELPALTRHLDKLLRVVIEGEDDPLWVHFEVQASWRSTVPERAFEYWSLAHRRHSNLLTVVLCLTRGDRQGEPVGRFEVVVRGRRRLVFEFDVLRVWADLNAEDLLAGRALALLPLVPFAEGASPAHAERALARLADVADEDQRRELRVALATFAEQAFQEQGWLARIPKEELMESTTWKEIGAEFEAKGERKVLTLQLEKRLGERARRFVDRLQTASPTELESMAELLADQRTDDDLVSALEILLPRSDPEE